MGLCSLILPTRLSSANADNNNDASFSLQHNHYTHNPQHHRLQPRMLTQHNRHISHRRHITPHTADEIFLSVKKALTLGIELRVVCDVIVALCQEFRFGKSGLGSVICAASNWRCG